MNAQLVSIITMFCAGIIVGAVIDGVRIIFSHAPKNSILYKLYHFVEIVFWLAMGALSFYFLFLIKGGGWRFLDALAQIIGIFAYDLFFQRIIRFMGRIFFNIIIKPLLFIVYFFIWVIKKIVRMTLLLSRPIGKFFKILRKQGQY